MVLGDQTTSGTFEHVRFDNEVISYDYPSVSPFAIQGDVSETVSVSLGDLSDPNLAPMAAWSMSDLTIIEPDEISHQFELDPGSNSGLGVQEGQKSATNGFTLDLTLTAEGEVADGPSTLLNMAGALQLTRDADGTVTLQVNTTTDSYSLTSGELLTATHRVEVHISDGLLSFIVDDEREEIQIRDQALAYIDGQSYTVGAPLDHRVDVASLVFDTPIETPVTEGYSIDETGLHSVQTVGVEVTRDAPMGIGKSYLMRSGGYLEVTRKSVIAPVDGLGFRVDIKLPGTQNIVQPETLIDLDGAMRLDYTPEGRLTVVVNTEAGEYTLTSHTELDTPAGPVDPSSYGAGTLSAMRWHTVAVRFDNGELTLVVDGVTDTLTITSDLVYGETSRYQLRATAQTVQYNSFKLYDWSKEPLLQVAGSAEEETSILLDGFGRATVSIESLGHLNDQQTDSAIQTLRVAVVSGEAREYVTLVSSDYYQEINGYYIEHLADGLPPIQDDSQIGGLPKQMMIGALDFVIPPAQAGLFSSAWSVFNFIIPVEDVVLLFQQLYYLAFDRAKFDVNELVFASLGTLTVIPFAKPLKPFIPGLKRFVKLGSKVRPSFFTAAGGALGNTVKAAFRGKTGALIQWLPMLYVMGEMVVDEESRESLLFMLNTISSENDLMSWVRYLSLPTDGWEGEGTKVAGIGGESDQGSVDEKYDFMDMFVKRANAASSSSRIVGRKLDSTLRVVRNNRGFSGGVDGKDFKLLINSIDEIPKAMAAASSSSFRRMSHSGQLLNATASIGGRALKNFTGNLDNLRIHPVIFTGILSYLYTRRECATTNTQGVAPIYTNCITFNDKVKGKLDTKLLSIATQLAVTKSKKRSQNSTKKRSEQIQQNRLNGNVFHVALLALYQFQHESNQTSPKPHDMERRGQYLVGVQEFKAALKREPKLLSFGRTVDLVLNNDPSKPVPVVGDLIWVEAKSLTGPSAAGIKKNYKLVKKSAGGEARREFTIDCRALFPNTDIEQEIFAGGAQWWLHDFSHAAKGQAGPSASQIRTFDERLHTAPTHAGKNIPSNLSVGPIINNKMCLSIPVSLLTPGTLLLESAKPIIFNDIEDLLPQ